MPIYQPGPAFNPSVVASKLPSSLQWLGGTAGSLYKDLTGAGDPVARQLGQSNASSTSPNR